MDPANLAAMFGSRGACNGGCLEFVALNGCRTAELASAVRDEGVPAVLGWRTKVHDQGARLFIRHLFAACAAGMPVPAAFLNATHACRPRLHTGWRVAGGERHASWLWWAVRTCGGVL